MRIFKDVQVVAAALAASLTVGAAPPVSAEDPAPVPTAEAEAPRSEVAVARLRETVVIVAAPLEPGLDRRDAATTCSTSGCGYGSHVR